MSLGRKLARLGSAGPGSKAPGGQEAPNPPESTVIREDSDESPDGRWDAFRDALRSKGAREEARSRTRVVAPMELPGEMLATDDGPLHRILHQASLDDAYEGVVHRSVHSVEPAALARFALDPTLEDVDPTRLVFLDTETTGLAGGAGTVPFLVGVAYTTNEAMVVEQWLLRRFGEETPILRRLAEVLENASALVTYNGKSFDWPLLRARYVLSRMPIPKVERHLDLVHGARRLLGPRLDSVRLCDVERALLDFERTGDLHGSEIPEIFLEFQRTGTHPDMPRVLRHHALDLRALPAVLVKFASWMSEVEKPTEALDRLACARVVARSGHDDSSRRFVTSMMDDVPESVAAMGALISAKQARLAGDVDAERVSLELAVSAAPDDDVRHHALLALAKHLEHRAKDFSAALEVARRAHAIVDDETSERRLLRLERRAAKAG